MNGEPVGNPESGQNGLRAGLVFAAVRVYANIDYALVVGAGTAIDAHGASTPVAAGITAGIGIAETLGGSYLATKGMGDFTFDSKHTVCRSLMKASPIISVWQGAPTGVMLDKSKGRDVTLKRRLVHSVPYGGALGGWVAASAPERAVELVQGGYQQIESHPTEGIGAIGIVGALAAACAYRKLTSRKRS